MIIITTVLLTENDEIKKGMIIPCDVESVLDLDACKEAFFDQAVGESVN